ncbi:MAG: hypothetical protein CM15mV25_0830 [uncultured marine virus]|nr:MAG: hypothetical protein CM15mV25_0830 [uncultured marine virus]
MPEFSKTFINIQRKTEEFMKLISEEVQNAEYLVEEKTAKRITKLEESSYNLKSKIEMDEYMKKRF